MSVRHTGLALLALTAACGKKDDDDKSAKDPSDTIFGSYTTVSYKRTEGEGCGEPTKDVAPAPAAFVLEPLPDGETGEDNVWFEAEGFKGIFALDTRTGEGAWTGVPSKSVSGFGSTCLLGYSEESAKLEGETVTLEERRYTGTVPNTAGDCVEKGKLDALYAEHKGKLACSTREVLIAKKTAS